MKFYLGTDRNWLWTREDLADVPLFVSHNMLKRRVTPFPRAVGRWALDSGGFTELSRNGGWLTTPEEYVEAARRYQNELGSLDFAAPQDWMCEPFMLTKTGLTVLEHQRLTVANFVELRRLAPELPFIPVLQGWELEDYLRCAEMYHQAGVDLRAELRVGVGSVCRRQYTSEIETIFETLHGEGLALHGFGVKTAGLKNYERYLSSADSMAWSFGARYGDRSKTGYECPKATCKHCLHYALEWRERIVARHQTIH